MNSPKDVKQLTDALNLINIRKHRCIHELRRDYKIKKEIMVELTKKALKHIAGHEVNDLIHQWMRSQMKDFNQQKKQMSELPELKDLVQLARDKPREKSWIVKAQQKIWKEKAKETNWKEKAKDKSWMVKAKEQALMVKNKPKEQVKDWKEIAKEQALMVRNKPKDQVKDWKEIAKEQVLMVRNKPKEQVKDWKELAEEQVLMVRNKPSEKNWKEKAKLAMVMKQKQADKWIAEAKDIIRKIRTIQLRIKMLEGGTSTSDIEITREGIADAKYATRAATNRLKNAKRSLKDRISALKAEEDAYTLKKKELMERLHAENEKAISQHDAEQCDKRPQF